MNGISIDFNKIADNYMHDVRQYLIEAGATSAVLLSVVICKFLAPRIAKATAVDVVGDIAKGDVERGLNVVDNAAIDAAAAATKSKGGRSLFSRTLIGAARLLRSGGRTLVSLGRSIGGGWLIGGIFAIDTASEVWDLIFRIRELGVFSLRRLPYDVEDLNLIGSHLQPAGDYPLSITLSRSELGLLTLACSEYSNVVPSGPARDGIFQAFEMSMAHPEEVNLFKIPWSGTEDQLTRALEFAHAIDHYYNGISRDDFAVVNIIAIILSKTVLKLRPGTQLVTKIISIGA